MKKKLTKAEKAAFLAGFVAGDRYRLRESVKAVKEVDKKRNTDTEIYAYVREVTVKKAVKAIRERSRK